MWASFKRWLDDRFDLAVAVALGLLSLNLYLLTLAPTVLMADGGEFQFVPYLAGIAHPTGYPLYCILGWLWSHALPVGEVAYRMNLFSAVWAALAVGLLYLAAKRMLDAATPTLTETARRLAAAVAAATLAVSPTFWSQAVIAEVYSFNAFFVALVFYLLLCWATAAPDGVPRATPYALLAAFVYGLSLTHHRTMILILPAVIAFAWLERRAVWRRWKVALVATVLLLLPLLLYLYVPLRAPHTPYLRIPLGADQTLVLYENTRQGFLDLVLGRVFSGQLGQGQMGGSRVAMAAGLLRRQFGLVGIALGLIGLLRLAGGRRWSLLALTGLAYGAMVGFNLAYFIGDIHVLFIPSYMVFCLWMAAGLATLADGAGALVVRWKGTPVRYSEAWETGYQKLIAGIRGLVAVAVLIPFLVLPIYLLVANYPQVDQSDNFAARDRWQTILAEPLPEGAVLVSNDRDEIMPLWYYQYVDGVRPDLIGLFPLIVPDPAYGNVGQVIDNALNAKRRVYFIKDAPGLEIKYQLRPFGTLTEIVGQAAEKAPQHPRQAVLTDRDDEQAVRLTGYDQQPHSVRPGEPLRITLYWQALRQLKHDYATFAHLVDQQGQGVPGGSDHLPGGDYYPSSLWRPGEVIRDQHVLTVPADLPPGAYQLLVGMYAYPSLEPLGQGLRVGQIGVKTVVRTKIAGIQHPTLVSLDGRINLIGYDLSPEADALRLTLYWQVERTVDRDYTVFAQLLDESGQVVTQQDAQPQGGAYPTSIWDEGEVVADEHLLPLPGDLPPGDYRLQVGMYLLDTLERLPVLDDKGQPVGDSIALETVSVPH